MSTEFTIAAVRSSEDIAAVAGLFRAYETSLDVDLAYQDFASELAALPGSYAPPAGELLLCRAADGRALGCVAMRPMRDPAKCEMKRLYVAPDARGTGLGRSLMTALIRQAIRIGYREMWLDTLPTMHAAQAMYRAAGFKPADAYYATPISGTVFMRLNLQGEGRR